MSSVNVDLPLNTFFDMEPSLNQKILLAIFYNQRRIIGKTRLQKLVFLVSHSIFSENLFEFTPYNFGPYSVKLLAAMDELLELGYINQKLAELNETESDVTEFQLSPEGLLHAEEMINDIPLQKLSEIEDMIHVHGYKELESLLQFVYSDYPEYTENSVIKDRVLSCPKMVISS